MNENSTRSFSSINCLFTIIMLLLASCTGSQKQQNTEEAPKAALYHTASHNLTSVIIEDIFSPPVASRIYAYANIAAWETLASAYPKMQSLAGQLNGLLPFNTTNSCANPELAALFAFKETSSKMLFSTELHQRFTNQMEVELAKNHSAKALTEAKEYGHQIAAHILQWASADGYNQSRTKPKHGSGSGSSEWIPTPPLFMGAIEPHWNSIRPFTLDSADQFVPAPPTPFDLSPNSSFYAEVKEVYQTATNLKPAEEDIARFWDCNPYVTAESAHFMPGTKKITPGGHWMGIAGIASAVSKQDFTDAVKTNTLVSIALADAFISCWDEKYRSNLIRPETVINNTLDPDWKPLLETPPFPEYTSGHSVISTSAAFALSSLFGDSFSYIDSVELEFGLAPRSYSSFQEAAAEAAISRLYGGIHYRPAIEQGVIQGKLIGKHVASSLTWTK
ncbi:MAG: hypothetical protein ACI959_000686 [Limisphaerales bacterium]|jgi:hypothetical protein